MERRDKGSSCWCAFNLHVESRSKRDSWWSVVLVVVIAEGCQIVKVCYHSH